MYSHKLRKVKKSKFRIKRDVVNNTRGSYTKHYKNKIKFLQKNNQQNKISFYKNLET